MDINNKKGKVLRKSRPTSLDGFIQARPKRVSINSTKQTKIDHGLAVSQETKPTGNKPSPKPKTQPNVPLSVYSAPIRPTKVTKRRRLVKQVLLRGGISLVVAVLATGGFLSWRAYGKLHKVFRGTSTVAALSSKSVAPELLKGEGDGRVNILLLGIGGPGHDGPDLTDTIVILSVDPVNNTAAMLSIPRDLWVKMPVNYFGSYQKINAAYSSGKYKYLNKLDASNTNATAVEAGFSSIDEALGDVLGININYHVLLNFQAFRQAIDTIGGVTVNVPSDLYDPTMEWENNWNPVLAKAGVQQMDGREALLYSRSRETSSDFARTERQRQVLLALKDKILSAGTLSNPAKIDGLVNAFGDNVFSDMSTQGASRLYSIMKKIDNSKITSLGLAQSPNNFVTTDHVGTISVVRPVAGFNDYTAIQTYVHSQLVDGYLLKEHAPIAFYGQTQTTMTLNSTVLKSYGYNIATSVVATTTTTTPILVDLSSGKDPYTKHYLEQRYGVKAVTTMPSGIPAQPSSTKFVILDSK